jgi:Secretion system C-terminal sorting domain
MLKIYKIFFISILCTGYICAQPHLKLEPDSVEFTDIFNRLQNSYFINIGNQPLLIDSLWYNNNYYFTRFNISGYTPFIIQPGDSVKMDCILAGYYYVPSADSVDTMFVYNDGQNPVEDLKIKIDYHDDQYGETTIKGTVTDGVNPIPNANVYFFYNGSYIINEKTTNLYGGYEADLPPGPYIVAAQKDSFYVTFFGQKFDPFNATFIQAVKDSDYTADIQLLRMDTSTISVSGTVYDSLSGVEVLKGVVVVRNGHHTPTKINANGKNNPGDLGIYTTFINQRGAYSVKGIMQPDYYFIQSFSDYFVPSYYASEDTSTTYWQSADSVYADVSLSGIDVFMPRDSSVGGGTILGSVSFPQNNLTDTVSEVILYAKNLDYDYPPFNYAFSESNGNYKIPFLPYGNYQVVAQKIGIDDAHSIDITIDPQHTTIEGIDLMFGPLSVNINGNIPQEITLYANYPNPFNPTTTIKYSLNSSANINLRIINILGQKVATIKKGFETAGLHEVQFDGSNLSSGVYFIQLIAGGIVKTQKTVLLK